MSFSGVLLYVVPAGAVLDGLFIAVSGATVVVLVVLTVVSVVLFDVESLLVHDASRVEAIRAGKTNVFFI
ncbi:hypothetical protein GCM10028786_05490 [Flaviaesturariibacter terrae]